MKKTEILCRLFDRAREEKDTDTVAALKGLKIDMLDALTAIKRYACSIELLTDKIVEDAGVGDFEGLYFMDTARTATHKELIALLESWEKLLEDPGKGARPLESVASKKPVDA